MTEKIIQPNKIEKNSICPYIPMLVIPVENPITHQVEGRPVPVGCHKEGCVFFDNDAKKCKELLMLELSIEKHTKEKQV